MPACHAGDRRFESGRVRHTIASIPTPRSPARTGRLFTSLGWVRAPAGTFVARTTGGASAHPSAVIGSIGSRLRLVLRQPGLGRSTGTVDVTDLPEVEFVAYSTSERLSGRIRLDAARLTDMLNAHREYVLVDALAERLPEGG